MKEVTDRWLRAWKNLGIILLGIPSLGFAWVYMDYKGEWGKDDTWKLIAVKALEPWVHFWRGVLLSIAGFPTLGFTWFLMGHLKEPFFTSLRNKYGVKS